ncbi:MAG: hypothetical protein ACFB9M_09840 [Myxococcota bacterium]
MNREVKLGVVGRPRFGRSRGPGLLRDRRRLRDWVVVLVVLHSYGVMFMLLFLPQTTLALGGFASTESVFFVRQGGVFHGVVATGYLMEFRRFQTTQLAIFAKVVATTFLMISWFWLNAAPMILLAAVGDGIMGVALWVLDRHSRELGR